MARFEVSEWSATTHSCDREPLRVARALPQVTQEEASPCPTKRTLMMAMSWTNSWMVEEWLRLARMEQDSDGTSRHEAIARDAADLLVSNLNDQHHLSLAFESAPDTTDHHNPTPDCIYADRARGLRVAIEVTRLYDQSREQCRAQWERFLGCVEPASRFEYICMGRTGMPPAKPKQRHCAQEAVGTVLQKALFEGRESVDLESIFGFPVRVGGLRECSSAARPAVVVLGDAHLPPSSYAETLREANGKLREWARQGHETMLVFDARFLGSFLRISNKTL